jgi:hypothetical protein
MSEPNPTPSSTEKTVTVSNFPPLRRLWTLIIISLAFNGLILLLLVVGSIAHRPHAGFAPGPRWMPPIDRPGFSEMPPPIGGPGSDRIPPPIGGPGSGNMPDTGIWHGPQVPPPPAAIADFVLSRLAEKLTLTDDEKAKIRPIIEHQVTDFEKQMEVQHAAMQKQFEDTKAAIKSLLDADQQKQLDSLPLPGPRDG